MITKELYITPETKLGKLLDRYPELEDELLNMSPAFAKLRNPVLRKTVAKVASLKQIAEVGNISLIDLINRLRQKVGIQEKFSESMDSEKTNSDRPDWLNTNKIAKFLDARPIIESGGHPMEQMLRELATLKDGQVYQLNTPFLPTPLLDVLKNKGYLSWSEQIEAELVKNYFIKKPLGH